MNGNDNRPVLETANTPTGDHDKPRKHDKRSLLVFFSFVAALALLVGLNMR